MHTDNRFSLARHALSIAFIIFCNLLLAGCLGEDGSSPDTESCPRWSVGDSMSYLKTTTVGNVAGTSNEQFVVTEHTQNEITLAGSSEIRVYSIDTDGHYIDGNTDAEFHYCPPPAADEKEETLEWLPGPIEGTGDYIQTTFLVTDASITSVSVLAGNFTVRKIVMQRTSVYFDTTTPVPEQPNATLTQYYVGGIGNVKEVEVTPTTNTTITYELIAYSYAP